MAERETFRYHWLRLRAVAHPTEDVAKVLQAMQFVSGLDADKFQAMSKDSPMETHHGLTSHILEAVLERGRPLKDLLLKVFAIPGALDQLRATVDARTDDDGVFYIRLDKQKAFLGEFALTTGEDCIQLRLKPESYPANRETSVASLTRMLASGRP